MKIRLFTIPNVITLMNLVCGSLSALYALKYDNLQVAFFLMIAAAVFDFFDGFVARLLGSFSEVGKQLDSLADMVSFGFAPSAILFSMYINSGGDGPLGYAVFIVAAFAALRLAKFNIDETQHDEFEGLPSPACALFIGSAGYLFAEGFFSVHPYYVVGVAVCMSWFMISRIRMFALKFKNFSFKDNALRYSFLIVAVAGIAVFRIAAVPFVIMGYILVSAVKGMICAKCSKQVD